MKFINPLMGVTSRCLCVQMLTSQVSQCSHPAVQLQFFETVVRYEKFFGTEPQFLPDVLVSSSCAVSIKQQFIHNNV